MDSGGGCELWVAMKVARVLGLFIVLQNLQMTGLRCFFFFFFFGSGVYYFIVVNMLFYCNCRVINCGPNPKIIGYRPNKPNTINL